MGTVSNLYSVLKHYKKIANQNKLDGPWQNDSDVEDMLLTWQLQKLNWKTLISPKAHYFLDAMRTYHTIYSYFKRPSSSSFAKWSFLLISV
ncbi:hypothetical protein ABET40_04890 [Metabacillus fastidiosus]